MDTRVKPAYDEFGQFRGFPLFFVLSKTLGYLLLPTNFLIAIGFVGAILMVTRFASLGRKLVIAAVLLLVICGLSPLGKALLYPLEQRFPSWDAARGAPDGIIVLGASIEADLSVAHGTPVVRGAPDRIIAAAALARRYPNARVVFSDVPHAEAIEPSCSSFRRTGYSVPWLTVRRSPLICSIRRAIP